MTNEAKLLVANPVEALRGRVDATSQAVARSDRHGGASAAASAAANVAAKAAANEVTLRVARASRRPRDEDDTSTAGL